MLQRSALLVSVPQDMHSHRSIACYCCSATTTFEPTRTVLLTLSAYKMHSIDTRSQEDRVSRDRRFESTPRHKASASLLTAQPRPIHCFNLIKKRSAGCFASLPSCDDYEHMTATANRLAGFHGLGLLAYFPGLSMPRWVHMQTVCTLHAKRTRAQLLGNYHGTA